MVRLAIWPGIGALPRPFLGDLGSVFTTRGRGVVIPEKPELEIPRSDLENRVARERATNRALFSKVKKNKNLV